MLLSMNDGQRFTFTKEERVTGKKRIETLFATGSSFIAYPFKVVFLETENPSRYAMSMLVTIPKKRIKSAVNRNRMKRLTREAFRLNKYLFYSVSFPENYHVDVAFVYVKDDVSDYETVEKAMKKTMSVLLKNVRDKESC